MYPLGYNFGRDWDYVQIHPELGVKFDNSSTGVAELGWELSPKTEPYQTGFTIYPDLQVFRTKDLFTPHPELPKTWTHAFRSDNVIVFLHGKINPIAYESNISKHPDVSAALMFGHQRFEPGSLIKPVESKRPMTAQSSRQATFVFLSSISVMDFDGTQQGGQGSSSHNVIPETVITDINAAAPAEYAESKYIAERLLALATENQGLRNVPILRLGQIAGPATSDGHWNVADWVPSLVLGSRALGVLPSSLRNDVDGDETAAIDWLTIDTVADVITEIGLEAAMYNRQGLNVFNVFNPQNTSWKRLLPSIRAALQKEAGTTVQVVSPTEWIEKLRNSASEILKSASPSSDQQTETLLRANPALKLIHFFDGVFGSVDKGQYSVNTKKAAWETSNAERASSKLRDAEAIDGVMMERWTKKWCASIANV